MKKKLGKVVQIVDKVVDEMAKKSFLEAPIARSEMVGRVLNKRLVYKRSESRKKQKSKTKRKKEKQEKCRVTDEKGKNHVESGRNGKSQKRKIRMKAKEDRGAGQEGGGSVNQRHTRRGKRTVELCNTRVKGCSYAKVNKHATYCIFEERSPLLADALLGPTDRRIDGRELLYRCVFRSGIQKRGAADAN